MPFSIERRMIKSLSYIDTTGLSENEVQRRKSALIKHHLRRIFEGTDETMSEQDAKECEASIFFVQFPTLLVLCGPYIAKKEITWLNSCQYSQKFYFDYVFYNCKSGFLCAKGVGWPTYNRHTERSSSPAIYYGTLAEKRLTLLAYKETYRAELFQQTIIKCHAERFNSKKERRKEAFVFDAASMEVLFYAKGLVFYDELPHESNHIVVGREKKDDEIYNASIINILSGEKVKIIAPNWARYFVPYEGVYDNRLTNYVSVFETPAYKTSEESSICFYLAQNDTRAYADIDKCVERFGSKKQLPNLLRFDSSINYQIMIPKTEVSVLDFILRVCHRAKIDPVILGCPLRYVIFVLDDNTEKKTPEKIDEISAQNVIRLLRRHYGQMENWELTMILVKHYGCCQTASPGLRSNMYSICENLRPPEYLPVSMESVVGQSFNRRYIESLNRPVVDEKWSSEVLLYRVVYRYYQDAEMHYTDSSWLGSQHLDIYIPSINVAIEYQGKQHYSATEFFGGTRGLEERLLLDEKKKSACLAHRTILIEWEYSMPINAANFLCALIDSGIKNIPDPKFITVPKPKRKEPIEKPCPVLCRYNLDGAFIDTFKTYQEASLATGIASTMIQKAVAGYNKSAGGFQWRRIVIGEKPKDIEPLKHEATNESTAVMQISFDGEIIATYESINAAEKNTGINKKSIRLTINGKQKQAGGFFWVRSN